LSGDTPRTPKSGGRRQTSLTMADKEYHRRYWKGYTKRQISLTLTPEEYRQWEKAAQKDGRKVGQQIKLEAQAYRDQARVPDSVLETKLSELIRVMRGIGNNLNQLAKLSNTVRRLRGIGQTVQLLEQLEQTAEDFIRDNHNPPDSET